MPRPSCTRLLVFTCFLYLTNLSSQAQTLLKDVLPGPAGSSPAGYVAVGTTLYFIADDGVHGRELWKSDGTTAGTVLVKDINPGPKSADIQDMTACNGLLFFSAYSTINGSNARQLWRSDGTDAGTFEPEDGHNDGEVQQPINLTKVGNTVFYVMKGSLGGSDQWLVSRSDGTSSPVNQPGGTGAFFVIGFMPSTEGYHPPANFTALNGTLFFTYQGALYKTVGQVTDPALSVSKVMTVPNIDRLVSYGNRLYFVAGTHKSEVWSSGGTAATTSQWATTGTAPVVYLTPAGNYLYFATGLRSETLWVGGNRMGPKKLMTFPVPVQRITNLTISLSTTFPDPPVDVTCFVAGDAVYALHSTGWKLTKLPGVHKNVNSLVRAGQSLYFLDAGGLHRISSQLAITTLFNTTFVTSGLTALNGNLYFTLSEPDLGPEPYFIGLPDPK